MDIALACRYRVSFNTSVKLGYPEIADEGFPIGGSLEHLVREEPKALGNLEAWGRRPVVSAKEAFESKILSHLLPSVNAEEALSRWLTTAELKAATVKDTLVHQREPHFSEIDQSALQELQLRWLKRYGILHEFPPAWRTCSAMLEERVKGFTEHEVGTVISYLAVRYMLSTTHLGKLALKYSTKVIENEAIEFVPPAIKIDLSAKVPSARLVHRLLQNNFEVVFFSEEPEPLRAGLEVTFSRLERMIGGKEAAYFWDRQVTWYVGSGFASHIPCLSLSFDDVLTIEWQRVRLKYFLIHGRRGVGHGWVELITKAPSVAVEKSINKLVGSLFDGVMPTAARLPHGFPVALLVRSLLFEELLRVSLLHPKGTDGVVDELKSAGWGFAGDEVRWERFLVVRQQYPASLFDDLKKLGLKLEVTAWQIGPWKEARSYHLHLAAGTQKLEGRTAIFFARHFALFAADIVQRLVDVGVINRGQESDLGVGEVVGFPSDWGSPSQFAERWGRKRVSAYARLHWVGE